MVVAIVVSVLGVGALLVAACIPAPGPRAFPGLDPRVPWIVFGIPLVCVAIRMWADVYRVKVLDHWDGE